MKVILIRQKYKLNNAEDLLVIEQNIGAFDVSVQEILLVAVIKALQQLPHERLDVVLVEVDQARLEQSHQIVVHIFKNQIERTYGEQTTVQSKGGLCHVAVSRAVRKKPDVPLSFLKSRASSLSVTISFMLMMLLWLSCRKILISLMAVIGKPSFSLSRRTFFKATISALAQRKNVKQTQTPNIIA